MINDFRNGRKNYDRANHWKLIYFFQADEKICGKCKEAVVGKVSFK